MLKKSVALSSIAAIASANWPLPALAADEELVPFTDNSDPPKTEPAQPGVVHKVDHRAIKDFYTPERTPLRCSALRSARCGSVELSIEDHRFDRQADGADARRHP